MALAVPKAAMVSMTKTRHRETEGISSMDWRNWLVSLLGLAMITVMGRTGGGWSQSARPPAWDAYINHSRREQTIRRQLGANLRSSAPLTRSGQDSTQSENSWKMLSWKLVYTSGLWRVGGGSARLLVTFLNVIRISTRGFSIICWYFFNRMLPAQCDQTIISQCLQGNSLSSLYFIISVCEFLLVGSNDFIKFATNCPHATILDYDWQLIHRLGNKIRTVIARTACNCVNFRTFIIAIPKNISNNVTARMKLWIGILLGI